MMGMSGCPAWFGASSEHGPDGLSGLAHLSMLSARLVGSVRKLNWARC